jgi:hypothetical protein
MRKTTLLALGLLCLLPAALRAQEADGADALTAQVPTGSPLFIRVRSLDRADAVAKDARGLLALLGAKHEAEALEKAPLSAILAEETGLDLAALDRGRPLYFVMTRPRDDALILGHPAEGAAWEGQRAARNGMFMELRDGAFLAGEGDQLLLEKRGAPTACLDGDVVVHVYVGDLTERHKEAIDGAFAQAAMMGAGMPMVPDNVRALVLPVVTAVKSGVYSVESFDYALTWKNNGIIEAEGRFATKPRSPLRQLLKRAGAPGTNPMVAYLPADAFVTWDWVGAPDWPGKEIEAMLDNALGEGAAGGLGTLINPVGPLAPHLTGRSVGCAARLTMTGATSLAISELKEGTDTATLFDQFNVDAVNAALAKNGIPLKVRFDKAFAKHGETELHRLTMQSENLQIGLAVSAMQTFLAAENGHLFVCRSPTAQADLMDLLDKVRKGGADAADHPHAQAMARLGGKHNLGLTIDFGALKPFGMMLGLLAPEVGQAFSKLPDEMLFSTAATFSGGDIHWRGDWPARQMAEVAARMMPAPEAKKPEPEKEEEDFK